MSASAGQRSPGRDWSGPLLSLFLAGLILDIGGAFFIKYAVATLTAGYVLAQGSRVIELGKRLPVELALFGLAPLLLMTTTVLIRDVAPELVISHSLFLAPWLLLPLLATLSSSEITDRFLQVMWWASWLTIGAFLVLATLIALDAQDSIEALTQLARENNLGNIGLKRVRHLGLGDVPTAYFGWSMLLVPATILAFGLQPRRLPNLLAATLGVLSTGVIVSTLLGCSVSALLRRNARRRFLLILAALGALALVAVALGYAPFLAWMASKFSPREAGTAQKLAQIRTIFEVLGETPGGYLTGTGIGSSFFSVYLGRSTIVTEVGHVDLVRQFGLPFATGLLGYVGWISVRLFRSGSSGVNWCVGLACLFLATATNPFLLSPVFTTFLVLARGVLFHLERNTSTVPEIETPEPA